MSAGFCYACAHNGNESDGARGAAMATYNRPTVTFPRAVLDGTSDPPGGVAAIAGAVRLHLHLADGPSDAAHASIMAAGSVAAALRLARAYVNIRADDPSEQA